MPLDVKGKLKLMRMNSPQARALFQSFLTYNNQQSTMTVALMAKKSGLTEKEVRDVCLQLERLKLGHLRLGRRGLSTRFEWQENHLEFIPGKQLGEPETLDPLEALNIKGIGGATSTPVNEWVVSLGGRRHATVLLPPLIRREDVLKIGDFCDHYLKALRALP